MRSLRTCAPILENDLESEWNSEILPVDRETFTGNGGVRNMEAITKDGAVNLIKNYVNFLTDTLTDEIVIHTIITLFC